jgi:hypothetical protein
MKRVNFYLTARQVRLVTKLAEDDGVKFSEMLRRLLDKALKGEKR